MSIRNMDFINIREDGKHTVSIRREMFGNRSIHVFPMLSGYFLPRLGRMIFTGRWLNGGIVPMRIIRRVVGPCLVS